ncbi:DUF1345 domain-containing protein [Microbacterium sp. NPDC055903]
MSRLSLRAGVRIRLVAALVAGIVAGVLLTTLLGLAAGLIGAWGAFALVNVVWVLLLIWPMDAASTRAHATAEAPGRRTARIFSVLGSLISLVAVGAVIAQGQSAAGAEEYALAGTAVLSVAASWALIQVDYVLQYARLYYGDPVGGIDFNQDADPEYTDFVYFGLGLGMTYQVADTNVTANAIRRIVVGHTVLAYLFATVILATTINLVVGLG